MSEDIHSPGAAAVIINIDTATQHYPFILRQLTVENAEVALGRAYQLAMSPIEEFDWSDFDAVALALEPIIKPPHEYPAGTIGAELVTDQAAHFAMVKQALYSKLNWLSKKHDLDLTLWGQCAFAAGVDFPVHVPIEEMECASWEDAVRIIKQELREYLRLLDELGAGDANP